MAIRGLHCMPVIPWNRLAFYESLIPGALPPVDCECECWKFKNKDWLTKLVDQLVGHVRFRQIRNTPSAVTNGFEFRGSKECFPQDHVHNVAATIRNLGIVNDAVSSPAYRTVCAQSPVLKERPDQPAQILGSGPVPGNMNHVSYKYFLGDKQLYK